MASIEFNTKEKRRVPISRNSLFYDTKCFELEMEIGKDYIETDMSQTVILYQVDASKTQADLTYGETDVNKIAFKTPIEVPCVYEIAKAELKSYNKDKNLGTYMKSGNLELGVYESTLTELGVDMKKGDYIGVQVDETTCIYYVVTNDGKNNYDNSHTLFGVKPLYRTVICTPVDETEFNGN